MWLQGASSVYYIDHYGLVWIMRPTGEAFALPADADMVFEKNKVIQEPVWGEKCVVNRAQKMALYLTIKDKLQEKVDEAISCC